MNYITQYLQKLHELCRKHKVLKLYVFGSVLTDRFNDDSDIDLLVNFTEEVDYTNYTDNYFNLFYALKDLFNRDVDLIDNSSIHNKYFRAEVDETKQLIYG